MSIPLVQDSNKDSINTSIIAIKRNIERINMLLGLVDSGGSDPDLSGLATKQELQDAVNSLQPVDEVTLDNMQSVTSNAVAENFIHLKKRDFSANTGSKGYFNITDFFPDIDNNYILVTGHGTVTISSTKYGIVANSTVTNQVDTSNSDLIFFSASGWNFGANTTYYGINVDVYVIKKSMFYEKS